MRFQQGEGLLCDYVIFGKPSFEALIDSIAVIALYGVLTWHQGLCQQSVLFSVTILGGGNKGNCGGF